MRERMGRPVDAAGLSALRMMLGLLFTVSALRYLSRDWVGPLLSDPSFHFRYAGLAWVPVPSEAGITALLVVVAISGLGVAAGLAYRLCAVALLISFTWIELIEVTTYLNHYYLMSLLAALLLLLPLHRHASLDVKLGWVAPRTHHPSWILLLLRGQIVLVYLFAGIAKLNPDWLGMGEPLHTWLRTREDLRAISPWFAARSTAIAMSWAGALYDLTIPLWLLWRPTRALAWLAVVVFHVCTALLFPIGVFPWLMIIVSTVFWDPDWPRRLAGAAKATPPAPAPAPSSALWLVGVWMAIQVLVPLRSWVYPGTVRWHEQGFRFSWRVMLIEKTGLVEYRLVERDGERRWRVSPGAELTPLQHQEMRTQPDLIAQYARHLADRWAAEQGADVAVYVDAWASLDGRPAQVLIDPAVDLSARRLPAGWIRPLETEGVP